MLLFLLNIRIMNVLLWLRVRVIEPLSISYRIQNHLQISALTIMVNHTV